MWTESDRDSREASRERKKAKERRMREKERVREGEKRRGNERPGGEARSPEERRLNGASLGPWCLCPFKALTIGWPPLATG